MMIKRNLAEYIVKPNIHRHTCTVYI